MQISSAVILFLVGFVTAAGTSSSASTSTFPASAEIFYWPLAVPEPSLLARISYDPSTLESQVVSYTPPDAATRVRLRDEEGEEDLVRIGLFVATTPANDAKQWVGSLTSWSSLVAVGNLKKGSDNDNGENSSLLLHLGPSEELYHVSLTRTQSSSSSSSSSSASVPVAVDFARSEPGPRAQLNKPVVLGPDGKGPEEVPEKSFFQKYWWIFLIVMFLAMSSGGGGEG